MHDAAFADAVRPPQCVILKLLMLDYSIGHELLLIRQRNPLVMLSRDDFNQLGESQQRLALIRAVIICSQTDKQNQKPSRWLRLWGWLNRKADIPLAIAEFRNYRETGSTFPHGPTEYADIMANGEQEGKRARSLGGPFLARLYLFVCSLPESERGECAMDFPMGLATFLYFSHLESEGEMKIENEREAEIAAEMAEHCEAIARENQPQTPPSPLAMGEGQGEGKCDQPSRQSRGPSTSQSSPA